MNISGLPAGVAASVVVSGPENFSQTLSQTTALTKLKSGTYRFAVNAVKPDSATFSPSTSPTSLNFEASVGASVTLSYGCSSVKPADANLDRKLQSLTGQATYNCADLAKIQIALLDFDDIANLEGLQYASGLTRLNLAGNSFTGFPSGIFDQMSKLEALDLSENNFAALPKGIFDRLTSLTSLDLTFQNKPLILAPGMFDRLGKLTKLFLHDSKIAELPQGVFDPLTSLEILSLGGNRITTLPAGIFDRLTKLDTLDLENNQIVTLPGGVFSKMPSGSGLFLEDNCLVVGQNPVRAILAGLSNLRVFTSERPNGKCPQKTVTLSSLQARLLTDNRTDLAQSDTVFFRISIDGVDHGDFGIRDRVLRPQETAAINTTLIVNTELRIEVFARANPNKRIGEAVLPIDADYAPGVNRFSLLGSGSVYVLTLDQQ